MLITTTRHYTQSVFGLAFSPGGTSTSRRSVVCIASKYETRLSCWNVAQCQRISRSDSESSDMATFQTVRPVHPRFDYV